MVPDADFRDLQVVSWETGCRPQEWLRVEAHNVDLANSRWVFKEGEGKVAATSVVRVVYLTERAVAITRRRMLKYPEGPLFRNLRGEPWTTDAVNCGFSRIQIRLGKWRMREQGIELDPEDVQAVMKQLAREKAGREGRHGVGLIRPGDTGFPAGKYPPGRRRNAPRKLEGAEALYQALCV